MIMMKKNHLLIVVAYYLNLHLMLNVEQVTDCVYSLQKRKKNANTSNELLIDISPEYG
jgi:hypothetical protein